MRSEQITAWFFMLYLIICIVAPILKLIGVLSISWGLVSLIYLPLGLGLAILGAMCIYVLKDFGVR